MGSSENWNEALRLASENGNVSMPLDVLFKHSPEVYFLIGVNGEIIYVNESVEMLLGYGAKELIGKKVYELGVIRQYSRKKILKYLFKDKGSGAASQLILKDKQGREVTAQITIFPVNSEGEILLLGTIRDATHYKTIQKELRENEAKYYRLFEFLPDAIVVHCEGKIVYANKAGAKLAGIDDPGQLIGRNVMDFIHPDYRESTRARLESLRLEKGEVPVAREKVIDLRGNCISVEITTTSFTYRGKEAALSVIRDISQSVRIEEELNYQRAYFQQLFEGSPQGIVIVDNRDRIIDINRGFQELFQYSPDEVKGRYINDVIVPPKFTGEASCISDTVIRGEVVHCESVRRRRDGSLVYVSILGYPIVINGEQVGIFGIYSDITKRKEAEKALKESEERHRRLVEFLPDAICVHTGGRIILANKAASKLFGLQDPGDLVGKHIVEFACPDCQDVMVRMIKQVEKCRADVTALEGRVVRVDGRVIDIEISSTYFPYRGKGATLSIMRDITERKIAERTINYLAYHDTLTDLPNRMLFSERFSLEIERARENSYILAVMFFDLDGFKNINDTMGHSTGDKLLKAVGKRLQQMIRKTDILCRMGGDEFILLLTQLSSVEDVVIVAQKILRAFKEPFTIDGSDIYITTSIGISIYPQDGKEPEILIRSADTAMYKAKEQGGNRYQFFAPKMDLPILNRITMQRDIRRALDKGELEIYYVPRLDLSKGQINGVETLVRWNHPQLGLIPPPHLVRLAEKSGLIVDIGEWVLYTACVQNRAWQEAGLPSMSVAVNILSRQLQQSSIDLTVRNVLKETGLEPHYLEIQITDDVLTNSTDLTKDLLNWLRKMGVRISVDNFGTGYSCLDFLKSNHIDIININRCFIADIHKGNRDYHIAASIVYLAHSLGIKVTAKGVERLEQVSLLKKMMCDYAQGCCISRPLPAGDLERFIKCRASGKLTGLH